jgi:CHAT domain-containing protein/tetratricopeptide (TPR) repeat protein
MRFHRRPLVALLVITLLVALRADTGAGQAQDEPNRIEQLFKQARSLEASGRYYDAIPIVEELLSIAEINFGRDRPATINTVVFLGQLYRKTGAYELAEPLFKRALTAREKAGAESAETAAALHELATLYYLMGRYDSAESLYQRALAIDEKTPGPGSERTISTWLGLSQVYYAQARFDRAEQLLQQSLEATIKSRGRGHPTTAIILNNLGELYRSKADYRTAESLLREALAIVEPLNRNLDTAAVLNNLGLVLLLTGDFGQAEPMLKRALTIREKVLGPVHLDTRTSLNNLASLYHDLGAYDQAETLYTRALNIAEKIDPDHPKTATSLVSLAGLYRSMGDLDKALPLFQRALTIQRKTLGSEHPETAGTLKNIATIYHISGAGVREPRRLYSEALAIEQKVLGRQHPTTASTMANLAALLDDNGEYAAAVPLYEEVLAIDETVLGKTHPKVALILSRLALLSWTLGRWSESFERMQSSVKIEEWNARRVWTLGDESRKLAYAETLRASGDLAVNLSVALRARVPGSETLGLEVVLQRKGRVQDVLAENFARARASLSPADRQLLEQWRRGVELIASMTLRGPGELPPDFYRALLQGVEKKAQALETSLSERSAAFRSELETVTVEKVQRALPPAAALVEWFHYRPYDRQATATDDPRWGAPHYGAFVLKRDGPPVMLDVGDAESIERALQELLAGLNDPGTTYTDRLARNLDRLLMQPLRRHLEGADHLLLSPDGMLNLVPFGALRDEQGRYLVQQKLLTYLTSGRDLLRPANRAPNAQPPLILAAPDYGRREVNAAVSPRPLPPGLAGDVMPFDPLPGTEAEARALKAILRLPDARVLIGAQASEVALKQAKGPRILHLATHGFFLPDQVRSSTPDRPLDLDARRADRRENPLVRSGLALAGANRGRIGNDGILTALEVAGLDLAGTELAVLSACGTGKGEVKNGEGVYGLRRALVLAGVRTQVVSLWSVADEATRDLMVDYYTRLNAGAGRSEAMRAAQLAFLANPTRAHPFFWAAFTVIGDASALPR